MLVRRPLAGLAVVLLRIAMTNPLISLDSERLTRYWDTGDRKPAQVRFRQITPVKRPWRLVSCSARAGRIPVAVPTSGDLIPVIGVHQE
jgi:hypothetical protein